MPKDQKKKDTAKPARAQRLRRALVSIRTCEMNHRPQEFFPLETADFRELTWKMQTLAATPSDENLLPEEMIKSLIKPI